MKNNKTDWLNLIVWFGLGSLTVLFWSLIKRLGLLGLFLLFSAICCLILVIKIDKWAMKGKD